MEDISSAKASALPAAVEAALAWLAAPPVDDPLRDMVPLRRHLRGVARSPLPVMQRLKILEVFHRRVLATSDTLRPLLLAVSLPIPKRLRQLVQAMGEIHQLCANILLDTAAQGHEEKLALLKRTPETLCTRALLHLGRLHLYPQLVSAPPPPNLWSQVVRAYRIAGPREGSEFHGAISTLFGLAAAQPESLSPPQLDFVTELLGARGTPVLIQPHRPNDLTGWYWLDETRDQHPMLASRHPPPESGSLLYFHCEALGDMLASALPHLDKGVPATQLGFPREANQAAYLSVLHSLSAHWKEPAKRRHRRKRDHQRVQLCTRLGELWMTLHEGTGTPHHSEWVMTNRSATGCGIIHIAGRATDIQAGTAVGLRGIGESAWSIFLVRWARDYPASDMELGLELVAPSLAPVHIAPSIAGGEPIPALLLPPLPRIGRGEALLVARTAGHLREFTLMEETRGKLRLAHCRMGAGYLEAGAFDLFQFERLAFSV